jgi:hypothetical protein
MTYEDQVLEAFRQPEPRMLSTWDIANLTGSTYGEGIIYKLRQKGHDIRHVECRAKLSKKRYYKWFLVAKDAMRVF